MKSLAFLSGQSRLPIIFQTEAAECGLACLAMIACYYGFDTDLAGMRSRLSVSLKGMNMAQLIAAANSIDLAGRPLKLEIAELRDLKLPCILHWDMNHFVVLKEIKHKHLVIHDPDSGERRLSYEVLSKHFTGIALELTPTPEFEPQDERLRVRLGDLFGRLVGVRRQMLQIFTISLGLQICALLSPLYVQWVVDHALVSGDRDFVTLLSIAFLLLVFVQVSIGALRSWTVLRLSTEMGVQWSVNVFSHLIRLPQVFYEKRHLGDIVSRFGSITAIQHTLTSSFIEGIIDSILAILTFIMMWIYSGILSTIVIASVALYTILRVAMYAPLRQATEEQIVLGAKQQSTFLESMRGIQAIKLFAREYQRQILWHNHLIDSTNRAIKTQKFVIGYAIINSVLSGVANVAVVWIGAQLILSNQFSIGMLFAFVSFKGVFTSRMMGLIDKAIELKMLGIQTERLADIVLTQKEGELRDKSNRLDSSIDLSEALHFKNLCFRYSDVDPFVLKNINLTINKGSSTAIIGPSGCGKTTLAKLLLGLLKPTEGQILAGNIDTARVGLHSWRRGVNAVMQDDQLFAGSVIDNISFFQESPNMEEIISAAKLARVHDDIKKMNMGYNTLIGDMGTALSGGQKQRVLLARALYCKPQILVLDEATSHLDVELEKAINDAIGNLTITRIVIAHRPETIAACDAIINLPDFNDAG